jgi:hypothetical protein
MPKVIENKTFDNLERAIVEAGNDLLTIRNVNINIKELNPSASSAILGCDLRRNKLVEIDQLSIIATGILRKYGYGLRLGYSNTPSEANGIVKINNSRIQGFGPASASYATANRDGIALEGGELWIKGSVITDVSDACIDCKGLVMAKDCIFEKGYRDIRIWPGQTVILSNCKVSSVWFENNTGKLILYKTPFPITVETNNGPAATILTMPVDPLIEPWFGGVVPPVEPPVNDLLGTLIELQMKRVLFEQEQLDYLNSL